MCKCTKKIVHFLDISNDYNTNELEVPGACPALSRHTTAGNSVSCMKNHCPLTAWTSQEMPALFGTASDSVPVSCL